MIQLVVISSVQTDRYIYNRTTWTHFNLIFLLCFRGVERCRHFVLNQRDDETYLIEGETSVHTQLEDLINYYCTYPVEPYKELLTTPCSKVSTGSL